MKFIIKDATISEIDFLNRLIYLSKSYWGYSDELLGEYFRIFSINEDYLLKAKVKIVYIDNILLGTYSFLINSNCQLELDKFFLHPSHIGKGFGRKLWQVCCETALTFNMPSFVIWSDINAESFFIKLGCKKIGVRQSIVRPTYFPSILEYQL